MKHNGKHESWVTMCNFCIVKTDISTVLIIKSGMDFFMISGAQGGWSVTQCGELPTVFASKKGGWSVY